MSKVLHKSGSNPTAAANGRLAEAAHLQLIESNPLTAEEIAMFEMFKREGWPPERCRAHILRRIKDCAHTGATTAVRRTTPQYPVISSG